MLTLVTVAVLVTVTAASDSDSYQPIISRQRVSQQCAGYCKESSKFSLRPGSTYVYRYEARTVSEVAGASGGVNDTSEIKITAEALVQVTSSPCDLILQLRDTRLYDSGLDGLTSAVHQREFSALVEQSPLPFSFQDGRVDQLCPAADEPTWALNLKRGILSVFQNSMVDLNKDAHLHERDISGLCETTYSVKPAMWSDVKVLRRKNLQSCSSRGRHTFGLPGVSQHAKSVPLVKSEQFCEQTIRSDNGVFLSNARCQETHVFAPFSNGQSGIRTSAAVSLSLEQVVDNMEPLTTDLFVNKRTSLQMDLSEITTGTEGSLESVWGTLSELSRQTGAGVTQAAPTLFDQLVRQLTALDDQQLVKLFDQQREPRERQFLLDALPLVGSAGNVKAIYQIYQAGQLSQDDVDSWLTALAFHRQPTQDMLHTLGLFVQDGFHPKAWLAVSSVVHSYCQLDHTCADTPEVRAIMAAVEGSLGASCRSNTLGEQKAMVVALKAIGNAGFIYSLDTLKNCFQSKDNPLEVRIAAIAATRRFRCSSLQHLPILQTFQDPVADAELRIAAYLAAIQCPTTATVSRLRDSLYQEDTNQVLSFVWTHLTNLQESSASWRREVRQMLQDSHLAKKFRTDARKFSRNYEASFYSDILNVGGTADSNIVFSTKSYMPRSANLNLTLDLFGEAVNIFEVGSRIEGFESVVEEVFSSKGYFPDESMEKMLKNMRSAETNEKNFVIQKLSEQFTEGTTNEPQATIFARVLGNELYLSQLNNFNVNSLLKSKLSNIKNLKMMMDTLSSLFDSNLDYTKSFRLINKEYLIPTVIGFPLRLAINSTATAGLQLKTQVDLENLFKTKSGNLALFMNPSAAVHIDGKMEVDGIFTRTGVQTKGSVSSNTYLDIKFDIDKGQVIDVSLNVPRDKVEIFNVTSAVFVKRREKLVEIEGVGEVTSHDSCSGLHVPTVSGIRLCSQLVVRNASAHEGAPYFPLTGRFQYAAAILKSDDFNSYKLHLTQRFELVEGRPSGKLTVEVDTPGSRLNRHLLADLSFDTKSGDAHLELVSPVGSVGFTGKLALTAADKSLDLKTTVDGKEYASVKLGLQTENTARTIRYEPSLVVQALSSVALNISGRLNIIPGTKYSADLTAYGITKQPIMFSGDISGGKGRYSGSLSAKAEAVDIKVNTKVISSSTVLSCKTLVRYALAHRHDAVQTIDFTGKLQQHNKGGFAKKQLSVNLQMSEAPSLSTRLGWVLYRSRRYADSNLELTVGQTQWKSQQLYQNNLQDKNKNFQVILSLESPTKKLNYRAEVQYKTTPEIVHAHALAQLSKKKRFISRLDYGDSFPIRLLELELATPWERCSLESKVETATKSDGEWGTGMNGSVVVQWGDVESPRRVKISGQYKAAEEPLSAKHKVEARLEGLDLTSPALLEGSWNARSRDGLILSDSVLRMNIERDTYLLSVGYVKDTSQGKHDLKVDLTLPDNSYGGKLALINGFNVKNITVQLDLEKSLYFTSQVSLWQAFDMQLFWNYKVDRSQSALIKYRTTASSEVAVIAMPGHYASLTVDKLGPGFSSMNITAIWGESEGSATNAVLLTTYWALDLSGSDPVAGLVWLPTAQANVALITPFIGFERQSFLLNLTAALGTARGSLIPIFRDIEVSTKWQDQFIDFNFKEELELTEGSRETQTVPKYRSTEYTGGVASSLEVLKKITINVDLEKTSPLSISGDYKSRSIQVDASYNEWLNFIFNTMKTTDKLSINLNLSDKDKTIISSDLSVSDTSLQLKTILPNDKKVQFVSNYEWPNKFEAKLTTPFRGYEVSAFEYNVEANSERLITMISGEVREEFFRFLTNFDKSNNGFKGQVNLTSSSTVSDVSISVNHLLKKSKRESYLNDFASISLIKHGKILQAGKVLFSYADELPSASLKTKNVQIMIELPGHFSSFNYTYGAQVKLGGVEVTHDLINIWNKEKTELSLSYEGWSSVAAYLKKNNDKKAELLFKNSENRNYRTDLALPGGYVVKHRLFFYDIAAWENFVMVSSPTQKLIIKNVQSFNSEKTSLAHKSTVSLDKEVAFIDLLMNFDSDSHKIYSVTFLTTTPWTRPLSAKYDLLVDTGATSKHEVQIKFNDNQEIKGEFDVTSGDSTRTLSFSVQSPYAKHFGGTFNFESNEDKIKAGTHISMNEKYLRTEFELVKNLVNPLLYLAMNNSEGNIIKLSSSYDIGNSVKEAMLDFLYFQNEFKLKGHYTMRNGKIKGGMNVNTPLEGWKELFTEYDFQLSEKYSFLVKAKKDEKYFTAVATGSIESELLKASTDIDCFISTEPIQLSGVFEYRALGENRFLSIRSTLKEKVLLNFDIKYTKETSQISGLDTITMQYNAHIPVEHFRDSSLEVKYTQLGEQVMIVGNAAVDEWISSMKVDNTFNKNGYGHLDILVSTLDNKIELYLKHTDDENDTYTWHLSNNKAFIDGSLIMYILNENGDLKVQYKIESSVEDLKSIHGFVMMGKAVNYFVLESSTNVNTINYKIQYEINMDDGIESKTIHSLRIALPVEKFESIIAALEYKKRESSLTYVNGEVTDGKMINKISYVKQTPDGEHFLLDFPLLFKCVAKKTNASLAFSANTMSEPSVPKFALDVALNKTYLTIDADNKLTGKFQIAAQSKDWKHLSVSFKANNIDVKGDMDIGNNSLKMSSMTNIPHWKEVNLDVKYQEIDKVNRKYSISIDKEREELLLASVEGFYSSFNGDCVVSVVMQKFFLDLSMNYDLTDTFAVDLKYNINGHKQQVGGKLLFSSEGTRIDLATPIRGFEDLSFIGNLNRQDKKAGLVFNKNGKKINVELSATIETNLVVLKGTMFNGKNEYIITVGAENGTVNEPKSTAVYIKIFKNKMAILWLSFEGSYDLQRKAGIILSFSSLYYKPVNFEISSNREILKHNLLFSYIYGTDVNYLMNATVNKDMGRPHLFIHSQLGSKSHYLEVGSELLNPKKSIVLNFKIGEDDFISLFASTSFTKLVSNLKIVLINNGILSIIDSGTISGGYDFLDQSKIDAEFIINRVKYFDLRLDSQSLHNVKFSSSLKKSDYIDTCFDISLTYKLALPDTSIISNVDINGEYYKSIANISWNQELATTFFQLTTNGGYGFENTVLASKYSISENRKHAYFIDFTVDDSTLFHISSDILYPSQLSISLVLPDSLFLPFVKEINMVFDFGESKKEALFKYVSGSKEKRKFNFEFLMEGAHCKVILGRSELDNSSLLISDDFVFSYLISKDNIYFKSLLSWENSPIFSVMYDSRTPDVSETKIKTLTEMLFNLERHYLWNFTINYTMNAEFSGVFNPHDISATVRFPTLYFLKQSGLSEVVFLKRVSDTITMKSAFTLNDMIVLQFTYADFLDNALSLIEEGEELTMNTYFTLIYNGDRKTLEKEVTCHQYSKPAQRVMGMMLKTPFCVKWSHSSKVTGLTASPSSIDYTIDITKGEISGQLSRNNKVSTFGATVNINPTMFICSNLHVFLNSKEEPNKPFDVKYETDCMAFLGSVNIFEEDPHEISIQFDNSDPQNLEYTLHGKNVYFKHWKIATTVFGNGVTVNSTFDNQVAQIQCRRTINHNSLSIVTSFDMLKSFEISLEYNKLHDTYQGKFVIESETSSNKWTYSMKNLDSSVVVDVRSNQNVQIQIVLDKKNEMSVRIERNGEIYEGKGRFNLVSDLSRINGNAEFSTPQEVYNLSLELLQSSTEHKALISLKTSNKEYYSSIFINKQADFRSPFINVKYKTPFHPLKFADINVRYSFSPIEVKEIVLIEEYGVGNEKEEHYNINYKELLIGISAEINDYIKENIEFDVMFGDKFGLVFNHSSMVSAVIGGFYKNDQSYSINGLLNIQGKNLSRLEMLKGKSAVRIHINRKNLEGIGFLQSPLIQNILVTLKSEKGENKSNGLAFQAMYGQQSIIKIDSIKQSNGNLRLNILGEWKVNTMNLLIIILEDIIQLDVGVFNKGIAYIDTSIAYRIGNTKVWKRSLEISMKNCLNQEPCNPSISLYQTEKNSIIKYLLNFTNGLKNTHYSHFSGNCTVSYPELETLPAKAKSLLNAELFLQSYPNSYEAIGSLSLNNSAMDALLKWRRGRSLQNKLDSNYASIKFGGSIKTNSVQIYINENKFLGVLESSKTQTTIAVQLENGKLNKNISVHASVQYFPMFILNISHTVFDSPCSVEIKVKRLPKSIESAVTIVYNSLKQQAFLNGYMDSNPKYAEFLYIDIWQQTHEASIHVEEKEQEITLRGKINSPALDDNFMIITIGNDNDKFDLNLNNAFIFKAFIENQTGYFDMIIFGNDYKLQYKCEDDVEVTVVSPRLNGFITFNIKKNNSFLQTMFDLDHYHFFLDINKNNLYTLSFRNEGDNILESSMEVESSDNLFQLQLQCDIFNHVNELIIKHTPNPILLVVSLNSPHYLTNSLELVFGIKSEDLITGVIELKQERTIIKSYIALSRDNRSLEITFEAPLFSEMDKAKFDGVFKVIKHGDCELKLTGLLSSADVLMAHSSIYFIKNEELVTGGLLLKSKLKDYEDVGLSFHVPMQLSRDMKLNLLVQIPAYKPCQISFNICIAEEKILSSAMAKWQDILLSLEYTSGNSPFYTFSHEWNVQYFNRKLHMGAWLGPKDPLTDYIYFVDVDDKRIIQISHALILKHNHFKSKLFIETVFKGHEKYGFDLELQNFIRGKIIRILGSIPQIGTDLGIDFGFTYESLLNYFVLAQIRIPFNNKITIAKVYAMNKIQPDLRSSKLNYTLSFTEAGNMGLEFEMQGSAPFIWQGGMSLVNMKLLLNNKVYGINSKSVLQSKSLQFSLGLETPLDFFRMGKLSFNGAKDIVGSGLTLSLNSKVLLNVTVTQEALHIKQLMILSKWRNLVMNYQNDVDDKLITGAYVCWDLLNRNSSQFGLAIKSVKENEKYDRSVDLIIPSVLMPQLGIKSAFKMTAGELFILAQINSPNILVEGKLAHEVTSGMSKSGIQLKWNTKNNQPKDIGLFYVTENIDYDVKHYFTLQHFALENDVMLTLYSKDTVLGVNLQYSPEKEKEVTLEFGHWLVTDDEKIRSGLKLVAIHPASNTLVYGIANMTDSKEFSEYGMSLAYQASEQSEKVKFVEVFGKRSKKSPQLFAGVSSNGNTLNVGGSVWHKENDLRGISVEAQINQKDPLRVELIQNMADPGVEAEMSYSLSRSYRMFAGMPSDNELTARLSHMAYGRPNLIGLASLRLNTSRTLWGKFELPPTTSIGQEFYNGVMDEYSDIIMISQAVVEGLSDFVEEDFSKKITLLLTSVSTQMEHLVNETYYEVNTVFKEFGNFGDTVQKMYNEDQLCLKTAHQALKSVGNAFYTQVSGAGQLLTAVLADLCSPLQNITVRVWDVIHPVLAQWRMFLTQIGSALRPPAGQISSLVEHYRRLRASLSQHVHQAVGLARRQLVQAGHYSSQLLTHAELSANQLALSVQQAVSTQLQRLVNYKDTVLAGLSVFGVTVQEMAEIVIDGVYRIREVRTTVEWTVQRLDQVSRWFNGFRVETYLSNIQAFVQKVCQLIVTDLDQQFGEYEVYVVRAQQVLTGKYNELNNIPQLHCLRHSLSLVYQKAKWFWNYASLNEKLQALLKRYVEKAKLSLDSLEDHLDGEDSEFRSEYDYNAENNSLTFTQQLPFEWRAFNTLPEYTVEMDDYPLTIPAEEYSTMLQTMASYLWQDARLLPYLLPPFGADALLAGDSIVTFDNSFYQFTGDCNSYLLAADLYHHTFSLIANYNAQNTRELVLNLRQTEILVRNNLEVYVNGRLQDLPMDSGKIKIERKVHSVSVKSEEGLSLECSSYQDMCRLHLDGWYLGKTGGLFGTYNNEASDDLVTPARRPTSDLRAFTKSWAIDTRTCDRSSEESSGSDGPTADGPMCEQLFTAQTSPFFPCFHVVNPRSFHEMCLAGSQTCSSVLAYLTKCSASGVQLWMPDFCNDDSITDATLIIGYSDIVEVPTKMAADVVFVVETATCDGNNELTLGTLADALDTDLRARGLNDNRFAFISFDSSDAQIQTTNGQIWTADRENIAKIKSRVNKKGGLSSVYGSALELAAGLPYRPSVSKVIVLIHCSDCSHDGHYAAILDRLEQNEVSLHVLQRENLMNKRRKTVSNAIGLEKSGAYPRRRLSKHTAPSPQLLQQVLVPQDMCTPIVLNTNGTLFSLDVTRKGVRVWSGRVAQGAVPTTLWKQCENIVGNDNVPVWRCRRTSPNTKLKEWDQTSLDEYMDSSRTSDLYTEYEEVDR